LPRTHDVAVIVVEDATIAHHETASRKRDDVAERRDAVSARHVEPLSIEGMRSAK
jgi:hypothetical protein